MRTNFVRTLLITFAVFAGLFGLEFFLEWRAAGMPGTGDMSWVDVNNAKLVDILSPMARAYNNVLAMLIATIGLAIPLTANVHTPTLIEMFLRDRINQVVLLFMAFGAAHVLFVDYLIGPKFAPVWAFRLAVYLALAGWALLIPYFFYVVRFLDPANIIRRVRDETERTVDQAGAGLDPEIAQQRIHSRLDQIGTIILKSLDRADRSVARDGVWTLKKLLDHYAERKGRMPAGWFKVDRADFVGLSPEALEMINKDHTWFEMRVLQQLLLAYQHALGKASDTVPSMSDALRVITTKAHARGDAEVTRLGVRFFNNLLREAIKSKNIHAIYDVYHQYRVLARDLCADAELVRSISRYFIYYAGMARNAGLGFVSQLAEYDLAYVVRRAYEASSPAAADLLSDALSMPNRAGNDLLLMAVKAKLQLGGFFMHKHKPDEAQRVRTALADVDRKAIDRAVDDMLAAEYSFFEVTDRQLNLEFVPPERREPLQQFVASLSVN
ncbi:MAG TPA: DUF2254 family protein [Kofleriaceae bacterium]|nr:DUF2254 family protein [Kofleriaceae bacterium]